MNDLVIAPKASIALYGCPAGATFESAFLNRRAAQEIFRRHRLSSRALQFEQPHRALAAGNREPVVQHRARRAGTLRLRRAQHLDTGPFRLEPGAGKGRQPADMVVHALHGFDQPIRVSSLLILSA